MASCRSGGAISSRKPPPPAPSSLPPCAPARQSRVVPVVDLFVGDPKAQRALQLPAGVQQSGELVDVGGAGERMPHRVGQVAHFREHAHAGGRALGLLLQDRARFALLVGIDEQNPRFELRLRGGLQGHRFDVDRIIGIEADVVHAAKGRGVLILLADRTPQNVELDLAGFQGELIAAGDTAHVGVEHVQQADRERAGRAHSGAGGHIGDRRDLQVFVQADFAQSFAHQVVLNLVHVLGELGLGISNANGGLEAMVDRDVHVPLDGHAQHGAVLLAIVGRQVGSSAGKAHAKWRLRDDHGLGEGPIFRCLKRTNKGVTPGREERGLNADA